MSHPVTVGEASPIKVKPGSTMLMVSPILIAAFNKKSYVTADGADVTGLPITRELRVKVVGSTVDVAMAVAVTSSEPANVAFTVRLGVFAD